MSLTAPRISLGFSCAGHAFAHLLMLLYPTVVLALEREWAMGYDQLIPLMLLGNVLFGAAAVPAGWIADRWSAPLMMVVFFVGMGAASVLTGLARTPFELAGGMALIGLFAAIYHPVGISWVIRRAANRGKALGINGVFGSLGVAGAAVVAGGLTDLAGWRAAFIVPGALSILTGLLLLAFVPRLHEDEAAPRKAPEPDASRGEMMRGAMVLAVTVLCSGLIYQATSIALPKVFSDRLQDFVQGSALGVGALVSMIYFCSAGAQVLGGWLADRFPLRPVYIVCFCLQVPLLVIFAGLGSPVLVLVATVMVLSNTTAVPAENILFARYSPARWRATAFGVKFLLTLGVSSLAVPMVSQVYGLTGDFSWLFGLLAVLAATGVAAALMLPSRPQPVAVPAAAPAE